MANNIFADTPAAVVAKSTVSFATAGINTGNMYIIYKVTDPLVSYVPGRSINGISGFVAGQGYYLVPKIDMDLSAILVPPINTTPQLATPGSFGAAVISDTEIDLTWATVTNATGYVVDRATDAGFTTGVTLVIYNGSGLSFNDTGRTAATAYYYRVRATAAGYTDSAYATDSATTNAAFAPTDLTGLKVWMDFTDATTITKDSSNLISQINDKSGEDNHAVQATGANQPLLDVSGAKSFGHFTGTKMLLNSTLTNNQPYTLYMVTRQLSSNNMATLLKLGTGFNGVYQMNEAEYGGTLDSLSPACGSAFVLAADSNLWSSNFELVNLVVNGASTKGGANKHPFMRSHYDPGTGTVNQFQMGDTASGAHFDLYEVLLYDGIVTPADDVLVRNYLMAKYAAQLPATDYIACCGDSVMAGSTVGYNNSYVYLTHTNKGKHLYNFALGGAAVITGVNSLNVNQISKVSSLDPAWNTGWALFNFGTNDDYTGNVATWKATYKSCIQQCLTAGYDPDKVIIMTPHYNSAATWLPALNTTIGEIATELGIVLGDLYSYTQANGGDTLLSDGVHLTTAGEIVAATFLQTLIT